MQSVDFERLRVRLLKGGVAPKFVKRTVSELRQHLEDLVIQEKSAGATETEARATAFGKLGDEDSLVNEALSRKEIQSWSNRYTKSFYLILPFATYLLVMVGIIYFGIGAVAEWAASREMGKKWRGL